MRLVVARRGVEGFHATLIVLCGALVLVSLVAAYPQALALMEGRRSAGTEGAFGLRLLREATLLAILAALGWRLLRSRGTGPLLGVVTWTVVLGGYAAVAFARAIDLGLDVRVAASGLRVLQYAPLVVVGLLVAVRSRERLLVALAPVLKTLLVLWLPLAIYQVVRAPPVQGRTALGSRAFGTFNEANLFGVTVATVALWLVCTKMLERDGRWRVSDGAWLALCLALCILSGSRTAVALATVAVAFPLFALFRRLLDRVVLASLLPALLLAALVAASSTAISGRRTDPFADARLDNWARILSNVEGPVDLLFGWGLGLGSNTVSALFGYDRFPGQFIADSHYVFVLGSFGLVGLLLYLATLVPVALRGPQPVAVAFVAYVLLFGVPFLPFELFPANVLLFLLWGTLLGIGRFDRRTAAVPRPP